MELVMYIGNDFIASLPVNKQQISEPGYISRLKRELMNNHAEFLVYLREEPEFWVVNFSQQLGWSNAKRVFK